MINKLKLKFREWILSANVISSEVNIGQKCNLKGNRLNGKISIGNNVKLYHTDMNGEVHIGNNSTLWGPNISLHSALNPIIIGKFCSIAKNVTFQEYNHDMANFTTYFFKQNVLQNDSFKNEIVSKGSIIIENDVWIGAHCVILGGAHISNGAIVAANSVVNGYVPPYAIVAGSPAKIIKYRFNEQVIQDLLETQWWEWTLEKLKSDYLILNTIVQKGR